MRIVRNWIDLSDFWKGKLLKVKLWKAEGKIKGISYLCLLNPLNTELNPICHLLALLGAHLILHIGGIKVKHHAMQPYGEVYSYVYPCVLPLGTTLRWAINLHLLLSRRNRDPIGPVLNYWIPVPILTSHMFSDFRLSLSWPYSYAEHKPSVTSAIKISHRHN
jgi:hypothetical protein